MNCLLPHHAQELACYTPVPFSQMYSQRNTCKTNGRILEHYDSGEPFHRCSLNKTNPQHPEPGPTIMQITTNSYFPGRVLLLHHSIANTPNLFTQQRPHCQNTIDRARHTRTNPLPETVLMHAAIGWRKHAAICWRKLNETCNWQAPCGEDPMPSTQTTQDGEDLWTPGANSAPPSTACPEEHPQHTRV